MCSSVLTSSHQNPFLHIHSLFRLLSVLAAPLKQTSSIGTNHAGLEIFRATLQEIQLLWDVCVCVSVRVYVCECVCVSVRVYVCECVSVVCECMC